MDSLVDSLKRALADSFVFYLKAQYYHWNVEGPDFFQYHDLFGDIYEEVQAGVDIIAEQIRTLDVYAPGTLSRFKELTSVTDEDTVPTAMQMIANLSQENKTVMASLMMAYKLAEEAGELGISNALQDRIQSHAKHGWMLKASTK